MTTQELEIIFLQDIGEPFATDDRRLFLKSAISGARAAIEQTGITLSKESDEGGITPLDAELIRMFAAWRVRGRASNEPMPPMLRRALHSRLFAEKMSEEDSDA